MARYFFHLHENGEVILDGEGQDFDNLELAVAAAVREARTAISYRVEDGILDLTGSIEIVSDGRERVAQIPYAQSLTEIRI